jgi:hypothetical protein
MQATAVERSCTMLVYSDKPASQAEIKEALEGKDVEAQILAMKKAVMMLLNGEQLPQLFITIVRFVLPSDNKTVQKLLLLYLVRVEGELSRDTQIYSDRRLLHSCPHFGWRRGGLDGQLLGVQAMPATFGQTHALAGGN